MKTNLFIRSLALTLAPAALFLPAAINSCLAQNPIPAPAIPITSDMIWHKFAVKYISPKDILTQMHWDNPTQLPKGVARIVVLLGDSSLFIQGTLDGVNLVREALKPLDVEPPSVQIKVKYVRVPITDVQSSGIKFTTYDFPSVAPNNDDATNRQYQPQKNVQIASGDKIAALLATLAKSSNNVAQLPIVSVYDNDSTQVNFWPKSVVQVTIVPHIQHDNAATFEITPIVEFDPAGYQNGPMFTKRVTIKETVLSNEPIVLAGLDQDAQTELLIFITPTLPTEQKQTDESAKN